MSDNRKYCCEEMKKHVEHSCSIHKDAFDCLEHLIYYSDVTDEYGIIYHDGGSSYQKISYCPWCGTKLPTSKRDTWFKILEDLGYDSPLFDNTLPEEFKTDEWWKKRGL